MCFLVDMMRPICCRGVRIVRLIRPVSVVPSLSDFGRRWVTGRGT